ncbi:MAG: flagellar biosynthesis protein FlhB [Rubrivivax sp. SCN 71-131]|nr:MAG: flagellar biosynthesis protein FlhB [Rubrivivax sp. SCN 71-131]
MADSQDKPLPASARKLRKAREDGQLPRSRDLGHAAAIGVGALLLVALGPRVVEHLRGALAAALQFDATALAERDAMLRQLMTLGLQALLLVLPLGVAMILAALAAARLCGGWNWTLKPLEPKLSKLNPISGLGRIFSKVQLIETLKSCVLATLLLGLGAHYLWRELWVYAGMTQQPLATALASSGELLRGGLVLVLLVLAGFALVDVPLQRWRNAHQLRMTHQEVKDEYKQVEGNAEVKGQIKARMRQMARRRMLAAVPQADLVVMNPTHYAVALKYDEATMAAPTVVAKGSDLLAMKIRDLAAEHRVPVLQAPPLARALYAHAEIDAQIPAALFAAVAQVLAWVYQLRHAAAGVDLPAPQPPVPPELDPQQGGAARPRRRSTR